MIRSCAKCWKFCAQHNQCRAKAPISVNAMNDRAFPTVSSDYWCGEYEENDPLDKLPVKEEAPTITATSKTKIKKG